MSTGLLLLLMSPIILFVAIFILNFIAAYKQLSQEERVRQPVPEQQFTIVERIGCVGRYNGQDIPSHVRLEDGRLFEYLSLAIKNREGFYRSTNPETFHIKVDGNLLYKQTSDK